MLTIGSVKLDVPFVQAALSGYSDLPMRRLARRHGAPYVLDEVMLDKLVLDGGKRKGTNLRVAPGDHPVGGQLMGAGAETFATAAHALAEAGYDVIDLNFACPVRKVLSRCRGGYLLSQPDTALEIVRRVYDAVGANLPVTVKMRRGVDDTPESERNFFTILDGAFAIGVSAVAVHGRTVTQRYVGPSSWEFLAKVKKHASDRVILGSGDLFSAEACVRMIRETGVDGVTIARGAIGNPWIFGQCRALWCGEQQPPPPSIAQQRDAIESHWQTAVEVYGDRLSAKIMRKFGIKYSAHHPCAREVRDAFVAVSTHACFAGAVDKWYDPTVDWPPVQRRASHGDRVHSTVSSATHD